MAVKPLVSVIIPTFNRLGFLKEAVESVEKQSYRDFELIIVDDGSTDSTGGYLESLPVKYIRLEHSGFPGRVRNAGAKAAKGKYLAFLDSDDLWEPEKLARQIEYLAANPKLEICHTRTDSYSSLPMNPSRGENAPFRRSSRSHTCLGVIPE